MTRRTPVMPDTPSFRSSDDGRLHAPAAERNYEPILDRLQSHAPKKGRALEIASGTGQHIAALAAEFPGIRWQPSDLDDARIASINAWRAEADLLNLLAPIKLNAATWRDGPVGFDLIVVVNLFHLISDAEAEATLSNIAAATNPGGIAFIYGPFSDGGSFRSDGDQRFDASLRSRDPAIGYKSDAFVIDQGVASGLHHLATHDMPANNLSIVFKNSS